MKPRSAKNKGKRLQEKVAQIIRDKFFLEERAVVSTPNSINGCDLILNNTAKEIFPYDVEIKCQEKLSIWQALKQAEDNCTGLTPVLIFSRNHSKIYIALEFSVFLNILEKLRYYIKLHDDNLHG